MKFVIIIFALLASNDIFSCSCVTKIDKKISNIENAIKEYDWIAIGSIQSANKDTYPNQYQFETRISYKGEKTINTIETGIGGADCGFPFEVGEEYLIYGDYNANQNISVHSCSRTNKVSNTADFDYLNKVFKNNSFEFHWSESFTNYVQLKTNQQIDLMKPIPVIIHDYKVITIEKLIGMHPDYYALDIIKPTPKELKKLKSNWINADIENGILLVKDYSSKSVKRRKLIRKLNKSE